MTGMTGSFLAEPPVPAEAQALYDEDLAESGYVWNVSRLWRTSRPGAAGGPAPRAARAA